MRMIRRGQAPDGSSPRCGGADRAVLGRSLWPRGNRRKGTAETRPRCSGDLPLGLIIHGALAEHRGDLTLLDGADQTRHPLGVT